MDPSSPEYTIVHRALDPQPDYNLVLLKKDNKYCVLYEYVIREEPYSPLRRWCDIDGLARRSINYSGLTWSAFGEMREFIREYVGEARWILTVLANT